MAKRLQDLPPSSTSVPVDIKFIDRNGDVKVAKGFRKKHTAAGAKEAFENAMLRRVAKRSDPSHDSPPAT